MVIETMTFQGNLIQASIGEAINPGSIMGKAIYRGSIFEKSNQSKTYCGKAINLVYCSLPNNRLELTAGYGIRSSQFVLLAAARRSSA